MNKTWNNVKLTASYEVRLLLLWTGPNSDGPILFSRQPSHQCVHFVDVCSLSVSFSGFTKIILQNFFPSIPLFSRARISTPTHTHTPETLLSTCRNLPCFRVNLDKLLLTNYYNITYCKSKYIFVKTASCPKSLSFR